MNNKVNTRWGIVAIIVLVVAMSRLIPHTLTSSLFNFSPLGGIALFSAAYFSKKYFAYLLPLVALWVSNLLINNLFYAQYFDGFSWFANPEVYFAFLLIVLMGSSLLKKITVPRLAIGAVSSSLIFFVVTNFYVWLNTILYPKNIGGLVTCYVAAIPFYWNTLASDLLYTGVLFGLFEFAKRQYPSFVLEKA
ncbi:MAG: hypothetical protein K9J37_00735 [Saprospiraceae bacterium]|nr:hypothetical protein [Saprospiraceae bacterium]MCF8248400.1 hypothetical protein [Saprospiraceae bacterium]MCF8280071.1 hypothetical protein [Bacteroidales bacterium]MCF8309928.1 hypothetical protein [Saprospiraceae bacterium]MCF8438741.1 hypothetical protein [Saprospiraceae bacterium]